ncbi:MAG: hypothetical protein MJ041_00170 [Acidaminococcaceae bacterium]|nr:hypothetical protein [Acidaminococcaceae bacterium]
MLRRVALAAFLAFGVNYCHAGVLKNINFQGRDVRLLGDCLNNGYCHNFVLEMDRGNMAPDRVMMNVQGGYWPRMKIVSLGKDEEHLFFEVRQGGDGSTTEYRIFALRKGVRELPKQVEPGKKVEAKGKGGSAAKEDSKAVKKSEPKKKVKPVAQDVLKPVFDNTESLGLIKDVTLGEKSLTVCLLDGTRQTIPLSDKIWSRIENFYNRGYEPNYQGLVSLICHDGDKDGVSELYAVQRMELNGTGLGYVAARLVLQKDDSWKMNQYVLQMPSDPKDGDALNEGVDNDFYKIYGERIYLPKCQGAYPRFYCEDKDLMDKVNAAFAAEYAKDWDDLFAGNASMGFEVIVSYEKILSVRFIGGIPRWNHFLHLDPRNGKPIGMKSMFHINSEFLRRMSELSPSKHKYQAKDLKNWYMKDTSLFIVLDEGQKQRAEQFKLGAFEDFLNPKNEILHVNEKKE